MAILTFIKSFLSVLVLSAAVIFGAYALTGFTAEETSYTKIAELIEKRSAAFEEVASDALREQRTAAGVKTQARSIAFSVHETTGLEITVVELPYQGIDSLMTTTLQREQANIAVQALQTVDFDTAQDLELNMMGELFVSRILPFDIRVKEGQYSLAFLLQQGQKDFLAPYKDAQQQILTISPLGLVLALIYAIIRVRTENKPVRRFISYIRAASLTLQEGRKPEPLPVKGKSAHAQLAQAINQLIQGPEHKDEAMEMAKTDALTGLPNRRALMEELETRFQMAQAKDARIALLFIDLDGFKPINDTYGHEAGDDVLKIVSERYSSCVRRGDMVCRLGGDEFVIMLWNVPEDRAFLEKKSQQIIDRTNETYWVQDQRVQMGASIGVAVSPTDGEDPEALLRNSDEAMYAAKNGGKNAYRFYS